MTRLRVIFLATLLGAIFVLLIGGYAHQEFSIQNFRPEWKSFFRENCGRITIFEVLLSWDDCCLETIRTYNNDGALPHTRQQCPFGYHLTEWVPMCYSIPACYPNNATTPVDTEFR